MNIIRNIDTKLNKSTRISPSELTPTLINAGTKFEGNITSDNIIIIDGTLVGNIKAEKITIGVYGICAGDITSETLIIEGRVDGKIFSNHVEIRSTGAMRGEIEKTTIAVEFGAILEAKIRNLK